MDENKNILADVQEMIVKRLNEDSVLSGNCTFIAENRKTVDFEIKNALGRQGIVGLVLTPTATYAGKYEDLYLAWQLDDLEIDIVENPTVNRGKRGDYMTGQDVSMRVFDVLCPMTGEKEGEFCPTSYQQGEDEGLLVNKCTFKTLVYGDHGDAPTPDEPVTFKFVKLLDEPPAEGVQLKDGWMWKQGGKMYLCAGQEIKVLGGVQEDEMSSYVESQVSSKADLSALSSFLPFDKYNSDLQRGFVRFDNQISLTKPYDKTDLSAMPTLAVNAGSIGDNRMVLQVYDNTKNNLVVGFNDDGLPQIMYGWDNFYDEPDPRKLTYPEDGGTIATVECLSSKADLSALPTKTSQLTNDSGFITSAQVKPGAKAGYAENSYWAMLVPEMNSVGEANPANFFSVKPSDDEKGSAATVTIQTYDSWFLSYYNGTTFNPPIELKWGYCQSVYYYWNGRKRTKTINSNAWFVQLEEGHYVIKAVEGANYYVPVDSIIINGVEHPVTYDYYQKQIETIDGQSGVMTCTRASFAPRHPYYELAYRDEVSSKADLSALASYLPLSGGTLSGTLGAQSVYGSQFTSNSECQTGGGQTYASFGNNGILMGRSPNLLRIYWPFNTDLGNNQTFATQEWVDVQMQSKADLSALNLALDRLATKAKYSDNTVSSFLFIGDTPEIFPNRENVVEVELGLGVSAIGLFTFNGATSLKSVKCNEGMVEIKGGSFNGCTGLSSIHFPSTLTAITGSGGTFGRCTSLYDLDFPENLKSITQYCFMDTPISSAIFRGKTMEQVSAMANYPWAIQRSAIHTWNVATQEWVLQQLSALQQ